jgi:hypothetical protein
MNPLTALSVASSAIGFLDFAISLFSGAYAVYKSTEHQLEEIKDTETISNRLIASISDLKSKLDEFKTTTLSRSDQSLLELCEECTDISADIQNIVDKLALKGITRFDKAKNSFIVAVRGLWERSKVEELRNRMAQKRLEITTELLLSIR